MEDAFSQTSKKSANSPFICENRKQSIFKSITHIQFSVELSHFLEFQKKKFFFPFLDSFKSIFTFLSHQLYMLYVYLEAYLHFSFHSNISFALFHCLLEIQGCESK